MRSFILIFLFSFCFSYAKSQIPENLKTTKLVNSNDAYYLEVPAMTDSKGVLIIMPGLFDHPYSTFFETVLVQESIKAGYNVMIPVLSKDNERFDLSLKSMSILDQMIKSFLASNNLSQKSKIVLGGFSIGGTRAIKYYHYLSNKNESIFNVSAIFAIDPPLDMNRLVYSDQNHGSKQLLKEIEKELADTTKLTEKLANLSVYEPKFNSVKLPNYTHTKLRVYSEPDILWYLNKRKMDIYDMNILDASSYINTLKRNNSNNNVELIITENKGFRKGTNEKHPHSWSILDVSQFLEWIE